MIKKVQNDSTFQQKLSFYDRPQLTIFCLSAASLRFFSEIIIRSSDPDAAMIFWLLFYQEKSNINF